MSTNLKDLKQLAIQVANKKPPTNYTHEQAEEALRKELKSLCSNYNEYRRNKLTIFELMQEVVDNVLPNRVIESMGRFAEVKQFPQGSKPIFKKRLGALRGKSFVTQVGLSGVYETFRLDSTYIEVPTKAYGGAAVIEFERFLDGLESLDELLSIIQEGLEDSFYTEVQDALIATMSGMPNANQHTHAGFSADDMVNLINTAKAYGGNANIFCTPEFAATITSSGSWADGGWSLKEQEELRNQGFIGVFRSAGIFVLPQSFTDYHNTDQVINPGYGYIFPTGGSADERIVKVAMEGNTIVDDFKNADRSMEIQVYKKFGIAVLNTNYYCIYRNTALDPTYSS